MKTVASLPRRRKPLPQFLQAHALELDTSPLSSGSWADIARVVAPCNGWRASGRRGWGSRALAEFDRPFMSELLSLDRVRDSMAPEHWRAAQAGLASTPHASAVIGAFARLCVARAAR